MPLMSVLMPAHDADGTVVSAVSSTLRALPRDAELVVLDDASATPVEQVLGGVQDVRLRVQRSPQNLGVAGALTRLLDSTDSAFVARMDADDICLPWRFGSQLRVLAAGGVDLSFTTVVHFWDGWRRVRPGLLLPISVEAMPLHLAIHSMLCHPTLTAHRSALTEVGGYRDVPAEDYDLWLRASAAGKRLARLATPGLLYRHHGRQVSIQDGYDELVRSNQDVREAYRQFVLKRLGVDPTWLGSLWSGEPRTDRIRRDVAALSGLVALRRKALSPVQRFVLGRTARLLAGRTR